MSMESTNNHSAACYQPLFDSCPSSSSDLCHCLVTGALAAQAMGLLPPGEKPVAVSKGLFQTIQ